MNQVVQVVVTPVRKQGSRVDHYFFSILWLMNSKFRPNEPFYDSALPESNFISNRFVEIRQTDIKPLSDPKKYHIFTTCVCATKTRPKIRLRSGALDDGCH